jgi:hypothetical protein
VGGILTSVIWKDKLEVHILTNLYRPAAKGNFCEEHEGLKNLSLSGTTFVTWAVSAKGTEWLVATQLENMEMDKKLFFHSLTSLYCHPEIAK